MKKMAFIMDAPTDCLHCQMRRVIHIGDEHYQLCGLDYSHGYAVEAFFKDEDLKDGFISKDCPLVPYKSSEEIIDTLYTSDISCEICQIKDYCNKKNGDNDSVYPSQCRQTYIDWMQET